MQELAFAKTGLRIALTIEVYTEGGGGILECCPATTVGRCVSAAMS